MPNCPNCGEKLISLPREEISADTAPFISPACARAWWPSELEPEAKAAWDSVTRTFGKKHNEIMAKALKDRDNARKAKN